MKKLAIIVTSLVLGTSSLALADHDTAIAPGKPYAPSELGDHGNHFGWRKPRPQHWSTLASNMMLSRGRTTIDVDSKLRFSKLSLDANGSLFLDKILIVFANGERQVVKVDKRLGRYSDPLVIDLDGRSRMIDNVMLVSKNTRFRSSVTLKAI